MNLDSMIKEYAFSIVRSLLIPVFSLAAAAGYITDDQAASAALTFAPIVVGVVWSLWNKYGWKNTAVEALNTMPPATDKKLEEVISNN